MNQPYTLYRHFCTRCNSEFISEFQGSILAHAFDHKDSCPSAIRNLMREAQARLTPDSARVNASNADAQAAIDEWDEMLRANNEHKSQ